MHISDFSEIDKSFMFRVWTVSVRAKRNYMLSSDTRAGIVQAMFSRIKK